MAVKQDVWNCQRSADIQAVWAFVDLLKTKRINLKFIFKQNLGTYLLLFLHRKFWAMAQELLVTFFLFLVAVQECNTAALSPDNTCGKPELWCKNKSIARKCGVLPYCKVVWNMNTHGTGPKLQSTKVLLQQKSGDAAPVKIGLYFESLCPACRNFLKSQLYPAFQKLSSSGIMDVELVPYGNAKEYPYGPSWYFYCQHGQEECVGNMIETCAIYLVDIKKYMPFIYCLETYGPTKASAKYCAGIANIGYRTIDSCLSSGQGIEFQHQMALKTAALNPPHQFVPWITVNGVHTSEIQEKVQSNVLRYVCNAYQGVKPPACYNA